MKCANCNCEIGNLTQCPYCGHKNRYVYRAQDAGQYGTVGQSAPVRSVQASYAQQHRSGSNPARADRDRTMAYTQEAPTRTIAQEPRSKMRRVPREITNMELLLRLILLMQCVIALLLTVELVISSMGV